MGKVIMKQITRNEAESLFLNSEVVSSNIKQHPKEMSIHLTLTNERSFLVKYDLLDHQKRYFIINPET